MCITQTHLISKAPTHALAWFSSPSHQYMCVCMHEIDFRFHRGQIASIHYYCLSPNHSCLGVLLSMCVILMINCVYLWIYSFDLFIYFKKHFHFFFYSHTHTHTHTHTHAQTTFFMQVILRYYNLAIKIIK